VAFIERAVKVRHNAKLKFYPDGRHQLVVSTKDVFLEEGWERVEDFEKVSKPQKKGGEVFQNSVLRASKKVFDIARMNQFDYFITWTLDKEKIDRYDPGEVSKKLKKFLNNKVNRNDLKYLIIPEYHQDGAIHMHGLISGNLSLVESGKQTQSGQTIYNMPQWSYGWSTAIALDNNVGAIARYITKYISKDFRKIFGNFYYAGGKGLEREPPSQLYDINYHEINEKEYTKFGTGYKYMELGDYSTDENARAILERIGVL